LNHLLLIIFIILLNKKLSNFSKGRESSIKQILKTKNINSIWQSIPNNGFNKDELWEIHSIYINNINNINLPCLLLIHGTNSSSITWNDILIKLSYKFRIFAIDLPGFGHSPTPECFKNASSEQSTILIIHMLKQWLKVNQIKKISLLGHSFGGFISINFAYKYPELVDRLILAAPVGILPILDNYGAYWGIFFKLAPIQRILTILAPYIVGILYLITNVKYYYKFLLLSEPTAVGHLIVSKYITINWLSGETYWNKPILKKLLQLDIPISFIYGDLDTIIPIHQGQLLTILLGKNVQCLPLHNTGHFITKCPIDLLINTIELAYNKASKNNSTKNIIKKITNNKLLIYRSFFNYNKTKTAIKDLYIFLISLHESK